MRVWCLGIGLGLVGCVPVLESGIDTNEPWTCPANNWSVSEPPSNLVGTGFFEGQVVPDGQLLDQNGDSACLWQFYGKVVVLDVSTIWCVPCQELAEGAEETFQFYKDDDVMYVTVLTQDYDSNPPDLDDLIFWADSFDLTSPVLADPNADYAGNALVAGSYPAIMILDRTMTVQARISSPPSDEKIREAVDAVLAAE
jgi:thiol-disulfide isomerase/thioredoxin